MGFGAGEQQAEVESAKKGLVVQPAMAIDNHAMHDSDLRGWAPKAQEANLQPGREGCAKRGALGCWLNRNWRGRKRRVHEGGDARKASMSQGSSTAISGRLRKWSL